MLGRPMFVLCDLVWGCTNSDIGDEMSESIDRWKSIVGVIHDGGKL